ncbi:DUF2750 domain-containing protein [Algoriphagus terrigena]|uniref:DUF2750 domain-containing protein n=1 Tax=Algoriphagus terrigena TaxID=344884 RepID=UPI000557CF7E|nr:DUF2750 domain-containing protein [Algoriphagus terrigena]
MSQSASQAAIFYRDVEISQKIWSIKDSDGFPSPITRNGARAMPFWSSKSRAELIIKNVAAYKGFEPVEITIDEFLSFLVQLKIDNYLVGINWSGKNAVGFDLNPENIIVWVNSFKPKHSIWGKFFK